MAELPAIGRHCEKTDCHQLDFLPVKCAHCALQFCRDHAFMEAHACVQAPLNRPSPYEAPACGPSAPLYPCSLVDCTNQELVPIQCPDCQLQICLKHRHATDHGCSKYQAPQATMVQTQALVQGILQNKASTLTGPTRSPRNLKAQKLAAKVQLMKLKMKSQGVKSVPVEDRLHFKVIWPLAKSQPPVGVFVSQQWSLGRVIDAVAEVGGVDNQNNVDKAPKLRLFRFQDGTNLSSLLELAQPVGELLAQEHVFNGDTVILERKTGSDMDVECIDPKAYLAHK
ncbi:hypothetical protein TCAL_10715 [Tigriopus californicus]|uniref:AN1-type domain-containing protein n=1 Tax=Tigriopus californicus TaxID=6832 RepID=A0A553N986_TIGCA|nr:AN1-type zinc finger protein 1-like [Tigriopus californicus]TRY61983.1 hypothetical protein TCAL_10715 [Tigriopus californicus]|eukprot:TCALIF_10715-PA protein Name:"Similar to ZFAND1 AN1-type zinc finger protein 1 (Homo sapiens)" AED:0.01 eAED:0.01 QI:0/-1/0/1/-1/1/1/0/282